MMIIDVLDGTKEGEVIDKIESGELPKIKVVTCDYCDKVITKKPIRVITLVSLNSDRYRIVKRENAFTHTQYFCSKECRNSCFGDFVDCANPPKDVQVEDSYKDEPDGVFYCTNCRKRTNQKTYETKCIRCKQSLMRTGGMM